MSSIGIFLFRIFPHWDWISRDSVWQRENMDQKISEYGHFSRSVFLTFQATFADKHFPNQLKAIEHFEKVLFLYLRKIKVQNDYPNQ